MRGRFAKLLSIALIMAAAFGLYMVKYRVQAIQAEITALNRQIEDERENLHVAAAEWAYLNQPERVQRLAEKYLAMQPMAIRQMADASTVPFGGVSEDEQVAGVMPASVQMPTEGE